MPELPDITVYIEALESRVLGERLDRVHIRNPFLLRTAVPLISECEGRKVVALRRLGKRIAIGLETDLWLVLHLMIAGRLHWYPAQSTQRQRPALAVFSLSSGTLTLTEAGTSVVHHSMSSKVRGIYRNTSVADSKYCQQASLSFARVCCRKIIR